MCMHFDERKIKLYKNFLDNTFSKSVFEKVKQSKTCPATVGQLVDDEYVYTYNNWCTANLVDYENFKSDVDNIILEMKKVVSDFYKLECLDTEVHFLHYTDGSKYHSHIDGQNLNENTLERVVDRDITCVYYFNDDFEGGEINFDFFNKTYKPKTNDLLIYPTTWEYMHSVNQVTGNRYALVVWFNTLPQVNVSYKITNNYVLSSLKEKLKLK